MAMKVPAQEDIGRRVTLIGNLGAGAKYRGEIRALTLTTVVIEATEIHYGDGWEALDPKGRYKPELRGVVGGLIIEEEEDDGKKVATTDA